MNRCIALLIPLALTACSAEPPASTNATQAAMPVGSLGGVDPAAGNTAVSTRGVPTSPAVHPASELQPLVHDDLKDKDLLGSGCAFRAGADAPTLLMVRDEGDGLVKYNKRFHRITAATPGREAIEVGAILAGDGVSFTLARQPGDTMPSGGSSRAWPATLTMRTADSGERIYRDGRWECGS
ncbi:hypothetical protein ASE70_05005 [Sphingomonas sp. Leaf22]|uniref:hypothetical protein n=1 Tax=Sphingomonas sp. Leaf22 TaxID=1735687 RepID=UPI0006FBDF3B|nr:hypothetical protein [Sphingomonas sp. Leaf22]KQM79249.1 hypothetical protein ASE70_05005 [Sphingomonas sp. Leaf22]